MGRGVEWAVHSCVNMAWTPPGEAVNSARLAEYYKLPPPTSTSSSRRWSGPGCWTRSRVRAAASIWRAGRKTSPSWTSSWPWRARTRPSGAQAILGNVPEPARQENFARTCLISQTMRQAELAWRQALARQTIAGIADSMERRFPEDKEKVLDYLAAD